MSGRLTEALSGGPRAVAARVLGRTFYRRVVWFELRLDEAPTGVEPLVRIESCFLSEADVGEITAFRPDLGRDRVLARFSRGDRCFGSRHEARLVSTIWISSGVARIAYLGREEALPPDTAYWYDTWTDGSMRGLRVASSCGLRSCRALAAEGFRVSVGDVLPENRAGMANALSMGMRPVATIGWIRIGPVRRQFRRRRTTGLTRA